MKLSLLALLIIPFSLSGQSKKDGLNFSSFGIPENLTKGAHAVYRLDEGIVDVTAPGRYSYKVHQVITILNKDGARYLYQAHGIDKFHKIDDIEIKVFNELGMEVQKYKKKDFTVSAAYDGVSFVTDNKVMRLMIASSSYPLTLEIKYTEEVTSFINLPSWTFQNSAVGVELTRFTVKIPADIDIRYKTKNIKLDPVISTEGSKKHYTWEAKNLSTRHAEQGSGGYSKTPMLLVAANEFEYDGHRGSMSNWKDMGIWYNSLVKQMNQLSDKYKSEIQSLVAGVSSDKDKIRILYANLQKNFRYVSIQLGIGGFRPFAADFVHEKKYGDCKALSNYMEACLSAVNIKSYSAWINAGSEGAPVDSDFPYDGFNHQILCVPLKNDTVWLECTNKILDFGRLGNFTENRNALLLTENGGVLVPTPNSSSSQNRFIVNSTIDLTENGSGKIDSRIFTTGEYKDEQLVYSQEKDDIIKHYFVNGIGFPNPDEFEVKFGEKNMHPLYSSVALKMEKIHDFAAGNKMFLKPRFWKIWSSKLPPSDARTEDFLFECPFQKTDTTILNLPAGYVSDALPKTKDLKCEFATYKTEYWYDESKQAIYSITKLELKQHVIPSDKYASVKSFFDEISKDDAQRIVIVKK